MEFLIILPPSFLSLTLLLQICMITDENVSRETADRRRNAFAFDGMRVSYANGECTSIRTCRIEMCLN